MGNGAPDDLGELHGDGVAELAHGFRPASEEDVVVGEGLDAGAFADGEVAHRAVGEEDHVFAAGDAVGSGFQGFCRAIQGAAGVAGVGFRSVLEDVVVPLFRESFAWLREVADRFLEGEPWEKFLAGFADGGGVEIGVGSFRERPFRRQVGAEADEENPVALLGDSVVRRVRLVDVDAVTEAFHRLADPFLVPLEAGEVLIPAHVLRDRELGELHLQADVFHVVGKGGTQQAAHVLEDERPWLRLGHRPDRLREHVPHIVHSRRLASHGKRLARGATCHQINPAILPEIHIPHIRPGNLAIRQRFVPHLLVVAERLDGGGVPFVERPVMKARRVESQRQAARTGEEFDGFELFHLFI